jgi:putative restriction endonuclease
MIRCLVNYDMNTFERHVDFAPEEMRSALLWFHARRGAEIGWPSPSPVPSVRHLVSSRKGIYKPAGIDVALSVRQTIRSRYGDRPPVVRSDGTWYYLYHQEGLESANRDRDFTNLALMANLSTGSPVAILIQTVEKPKVKYRVQGLAVVAHWQDGYFFFEGFNENGELHLDGNRSADSILMTEAGTIVEQESSVDLDMNFDARLRTMASVIRRQGQGAFRTGLLRIYDFRCAITGCSVIQVLDASHIQPYKGTHTSQLSNGLLLRTDLHSLVDFGLMAVHPEDRTLIVSTALRETEYASLNGTQLRSPIEPEHSPSVSSLQAHLEWCGDRL